MTRLSAIVPLACMALLGACEDETLSPPTATADAMFARYVAMGNSITAGFQSGGINDSTQRQSYAFLLAQAMGTTFHVPLFNRPGCPAPFTNIFTQERLGGAAPTDCAFRAGEIPEFLNNIAFPGADVLEILNNQSTIPSATDVFKTTILGGRTQLQAAALVQPTFVSVWVGNNDALAAVLTVGDAGNPALVTDAASFASRYANMMDSLDAIGSIQGGVLIGAVQVASAPYLTQGRVWRGVFEPQFDALTHSQLNAAFQTRSGGIPLPFTANMFDVNVNCFANQPLGGADTAWASIPFHLGGPILTTASTRAADSATVDSLFTFAQQVLVFMGGGPVPDSSLLPAPTQMDCSANDAVTAAEVANLFATVAGYNAAIQSEATARGWAFFDPNTLLRQAAADTSAIRPFPAFPGTASPTATVATPFGSLLSLDGVHPSASAHRLIAGALIQAINAAYGTSIPALP